MITTLTKCQLIVLPTANSAAAVIAKKVCNGGGKGLNAKQLWQEKLRAYVLLGVEAELDCADPAEAQYALQQASLVIAMNSYVTDTMLTYADVILPVTPFSETSGTFIGIDNQWQSFKGAVSAKGNSRPAWKVLRVLGNLANLKDFDYVSSQDVRDDVRDQLNLVSTAQAQCYIPSDLLVESSLMTISEVPMYQGDAIVRRSTALQQTAENQRASVARMNASEADIHGMSDADNIVVTQADNSIEMAFEIDNSIADGCLYLAAGTEQTSSLGALFSDVTVQAGEAS